MLGSKTSIPFYVTATALGKLGHPEGEVVLTRASHSHDIIQMVALPPHPLLPTPSSIDLSHTQ